MEDAAEHLSSPVAHDSSHRIEIASNWAAADAQVGPAVPFESDIISASQV